MSMRHAAALPRLLLPAALAALLSLAGCSDADPTGEGGTLRVAQTGGGEFTTIQAAVDAAAPGARVVIEDGVYLERVTLFKQVILSGADGGAVIQVAGAPFPVPDESSGLSSTATLIISGTNDVLVENLTVVGSQDGIQIRNSRDITISGVVASGNGDDGIDVRNSSNVTITGTFNGNGDKGVQVRDNSFGVVVDGSEIDGNTDRGVRIRQSASCTLTASSVTNNGDDGIQVRDSSAIEVRGNTVTGNAGYGLRIENSPGTVNDGNTFAGNGQGDVRID